ncbi:conserved hypothetical protein [Culex quinquefasciatus]|uniref:Uncharacterized protein n=1 Tax=Culex quinquefasciatus TaxID=7176 RepID=B0W3S6_CULQU|nr:conserved hypothetical protein [Culex quinquefasciatus]|eukprot:XP_001843360.1 conserved hypothetical protein [Culex quinquefasciatus]
MASIASRFFKRRFTLAALSIILYWILSSPYNTFETEIVLHGTKPEVVWEYVADFSKMKTLNPTILDFNIVKDHGNVHHWQYSVEYTERLSHWPYSKNVALGHFSVRKLPEAEGGQYSVASTHKTCFLLGLFCLNSEGEFKISYLNEHDTYCQETVKYQCPFLFGRFCRREVEYQRTAIMGNLQKHFKVKTH